MIDIGKLQTDVEAIAASKRVSIRTICERANVAFSNWGRWKRRKSTPTFATWGRIEGQVALLRGIPSSALGIQGIDSKAGHAGELNSRPIPETELSPQLDGLPALSAELASRGASPSSFRSSCAVLAKAARSAKPRKTKSQCGKIPDFRVENPHRKEPAHSGKTHTTGHGGETPTTLDISGWGAGKGSGLRPRPTSEPGAPLPTLARKSQRGTAA